MEKVSVLMGIYNCETTLAEAIDSILAQSFSDWKLILCDDGSVDGTRNLAMDYVSRYPEKIVLLVNETNQGLNYTLNRCLSEARGDYVARMDGDDISHPERLKKEVEFLDHHPEYSIVSTAMVHFDQSGEWGRSEPIEIPQKKDFIRHSPVHCHAPCMIRRGAIVSVGGYTVDPRMLRFEDVDLWYKLYAAGFRGYNLKEELYKMRDDREAAHRRSLRSRMNGVYVTYVGFHRFHFPWYYYGYVAVDFLKHFLKGIIPEKLYVRIHREKLNAARRRITGLGAYEENNDR